VHYDLVLQNDTSRPAVVSFGIVGPTIRSGCGLVLH
jgi:hypothetical protein